MFEISTRNRNVHGDKCFLQSSLICEEPTATAVSYSPAAVPASLPATLIASHAGLPDSDLALAPSADVTLLSPSNYRKGDRAPDAAQQAWLSMKGGSLAVTAVATVTPSDFTIKSSGTSRSGVTKACAQIVAFATTATHGNLMTEGSETEFWREEETCGTAATALPQSDGTAAAAPSAVDSPDVRVLSASPHNRDNVLVKKPSALARLRRKVLSVQQLWIWPFTHYKPTNQVMLCYRTLFQDLGYPGANKDYLAAKFRDELMPLRGWVHRKLPKLLHINKAFIQGFAFGCPGIMTYLDARTRWLDEEVNAAVREGFTQVVVVAAGFDTRAYRLTAPGVSFFEIDLPEASRIKQELVERILPETQFPRPTFIAADLSEVSIADALLGKPFSARAAANAAPATPAATPAAAIKQHLSSRSSDDSSTAATSATTAVSPNFASTPVNPTPTSLPTSGGIVGGARDFNPKARTLFTVEGLLYYLPPLAVSQLLVDIRAVAAPGSRVAFDFLHQDVFSGRRWELGFETLRLTVRNKGEPKRSALDPATLGDYLAPMGWRLRYLPSPHQVAATMYPQKTWSRLKPVLPPFYNFAVAEAE